MPDAVLTAVIAAVVSLGVSLLTTTSAKFLQAREQRRRLTEKMLDLRLKAYPLAFEITDQVIGRVLFNKEKPITPDAIRAICERLQKWHRTKAGFVLTANSISAYRALRDALAVPSADSSYTQDQLKAIWNAKNRLRNALKSDLYLLYEEDPKRRVRKPSKDRKDHFEGRSPGDGSPLAPPEP